MLTYERPPGERPPWDPAPSPHLPPRPQRHCHYHPPILLTSCNTQTKKTTWRIFLYLGVRTIVIGYHTRIHAPSFRLLIFPALVLVPFREIDERCSARREGDDGMVPVVPLEMMQRVTLKLHMSLYLIILSSKPCARGGAILFRSSSYEIWIFEALYLVTSILGHVGKRK
jgi:hypothetical protein